MMWFKQLSVYRLVQTPELSSPQWQEKLAALPFTPCSQQQTQSQGWVSPVGKENTLLSLENNGCILLCLKQQERLLPSAVITEKLEEKIAELQHKEQREVYKKEKQTLKDDLIIELLPRAFTRSKLLHAYIDTQQQLLFVNSASASKAEALLNHLRETLGSLSVIPLSCKNIASQSFTHWLLQRSLPEAFNIGQNAVLKDPKEGSSIRCTQQDLLADEILAHLNAGLWVSQLQLIWRDKITFTVDEKLGIKQVKFENIDNEQDYDDIASQMDADFALMNGEFAAFVHDLLQALGGEASL